MTDFFRFPHTPHIAWLASGAPRDDKVLSPDEAAEFLAGDVVIEEKLDGANLGLSVSPDGVLRAQNRGQYLPQPYHGQFSRLGPWLAAHEDRLFDALGTHLIAFGEWCAARHSLNYVSLPDWWLVFDVYDLVSEKFWSTERRNAWAAQLGLMTVPKLHTGHVDMHQLLEWVNIKHSQFRQGPLEGLIIRRENGEWLEQRAKLVRADFTQAIEDHWRSRALQWNHVESQFIS
ncbi:MAG: RNA ligase family protein [Candidatus Saccharibacteria bacterium]|nr:RNA ligase family protein [Rhodoferax sp.]